VSEKSCLLTGATSFTGAYIAKLLLENAFEVYAPLRLKADEYKGLKAERLSLLPEAKIIAPCDISSEALIAEINKLKPTIFINHGGHIENYRSEDFDFLKHLEVNLKHVKALIKSLKQNGCKLFIHSGSAFEPGGSPSGRGILEGSYSLYGISPYGVAKKMVWDMLAFWCNKEGLNAVKIIIPNPYGHLENEDRLLPIFAASIKSGKPVQLSNASDVRNNIRGEKLAEYYLEACNLALNETSPASISEVQPIGHIETQEQFVKRALQEQPYNLSLKDIESLLTLI